MHEKAISRSFLLLYMSIYKPPLKTKRNHRYQKNPNKQTKPQKPVRRSNMLKMMLKYKLTDMCVYTCTNWCFAREVKLQSIPIQFFEMGEQVAG